MNDNVTGLGVLDILLIVNIVLKLVGSIHWSWWLVLWPLWTQVIIIIVVIIMILIIKKWSDKNETLA